MEEDELINREYPKDDIDRWVEAYMEYKSYLIFEYGHGPELQMFKKIFRDVNKLIDDDYFNIENEEEEE